MSCSRCGRANRAGARFCGGCGATLAPRCPACGSECEPGAQFCDACGASLAARPAEDAVARKVVTIVFADLVGSVSLHERLDAESTRRFMDRYHRAMGAAVEAHGGTVVQLLGDGVLAAFGVPRVAEDDAIRAVRAALAMQGAFRELAQAQSEVVGNVGLRVAINTGEVVVSDDQTSVIGDPTNVAARLQQEAHEGDVVIGEATQRLVSRLVTLAPFGTFALKGRAEPVVAYRVVSLDRPAGAQATAFVGREDELRRITAVYDAAASAPGPRLAVILGSPGLGKSRLLVELARRLGGRATVLTAHCDAAGGTTFAPIAEALRAHLRIEDTGSRDALRAAIDAVVPGDESERARMAAGIGALLAGTPASPEETFFVVRRLLAALAAARPVVLAIDDLQWAEPLLLDLTEHLVQWSGGVPLLVLVAARPELRDTRSSLAAPGGLVADVVTLTGLDAGAATRLAANVIGADELPAAVAGRVLATSEGNPLFVGELVRMLVQDGALVREGDRWITGAALADLEMPPTIHALLAARIERLRPEERTVLERAAIVGRHFSRSAVAHLLPREIADLDARLESLRRSELIEPDTGWFLGEPALRFHHVLIRDAAYRRVLKGTRAELHGRFADWLAAKAGGAGEHDETMGWHLEQAHQHLRELGPLDEQGRALGERAARHLAAAGRRALARDDLPLAAGLLGRALDRLDAADPARADLALDWCEALLSAGEVGPASRAIEELGRFTKDSERLRAWHTCFAGQLAALTDPKALRTTADAVAAAAEVLTSAGDAAGEAKAHSVHALALVRLGRIGPCEAALDRALAAARRAGDRRRSNAVLAGAPQAALWGPSPVTRASGRCLDVVRVLRITQGAPAVEAVALRCQAVLEALRGRTEAARRMIASSRHLVEELGITQRLLEADVFAGIIELLEGDAAGAERCLRSAYDGLRELGLGIDAAQAAALLGRALLAQGRADEAEALSHESEALAGDDLKAAIAWRGVRAEALARRGEHAAAVDFARAAVDIAAATDALLDHADARQALAIALRSAGRRDEAGAEQARAIELWEAKGATLLAERARSDASSVARVEPTAEPTRGTRRRVRHNAATANAARLDAAIAARDSDAFPTLIADDAEMVDHPTGAEYDRRGALVTFRSLLSLQDLVYQNEPLASLGDSLALCRQWFSFGPLTERDVVPFGAVQKEEINLVEVDARGRRRRSEAFAADRLGDAIARLYARYADLLPEGPERDRAAATARSVATILASLDPERWASAFAPDMEYADRRTLGFGSGRGAETFLRGMHALHEVARDLARRVDDVIGVRSDTLLVRTTISGVDRAGGGRFDRQLLALGVSGGDGLVIRWELFDSDRDTEALARFDELVTEPPPRIRRRVRPNAATANAERMDAAMTMRDADGVWRLLADDLKSFHHPTVTAYDREGWVRWMRILLGASDLTFRHDPVATLGDSLGLFGAHTSFSELAGDSFAPFGPVERETLVLFEIDARGRQRSIEFFASDRLGDAIARLYERHAELLPEGAERDRAAATARSVAAVLGSYDPQRWATALAPGVEFVDHRTLGLGRARGAEAFLRALRSIYELAEDVATRVDDVLDLRPDAFLLRWTNFGTDRAGGGAFERPFCVAWIFGTDGLLSYGEQFDADRESEALARFDELVAERPQPIRRRVAPNAATAHADRLERVIATRDIAALDGLLADRCEIVDHQNGVTYDRREALDSLRWSLRLQDLNYRREPLAALGDALLLQRQSWESGSGPIDVGAFQREEIFLVEVDAHGRRRAGEIFPAHRLGDAITRLYQRYAELFPEGPEHDRAAATARSVAAVLGPFDLDRYATGIAPNVEFVDHRIVGFPSGRGVEELLRSIGSLLDTANDVATRVDDVLGSRPDALLMRWTTSGTDRVSRGAFEWQFLRLCLFGADGLLTRAEQFDVEDLDRALARFDELGAEPQAAARFENAATRHLQEVDRCWRQRDWDGALACLAPTHRMEDRRAFMRLHLDAEQYVASLRVIFDNASIALHNELLATRGERLALVRMRVEGDADGSRITVEYFWLGEVDTAGRRTVNVLFDLDDLDAAYAELDARYAAGEPASFPRVSAPMRSFVQGIAARDWNAVRAVLAPDLVLRDHRPLGWGMLEGSATYLATLESLIDLAPDVRLRVHHMRLSERAALFVDTWVGTREGGAFEAPRAVAFDLDARGRICGMDLYDLDQLDAAFARYEELSAEPAAPGIENAATRAQDRAIAAWASRDWERFAALFPANFRSSDRRSLMHLELGRDELLATMRPLFEMASLESSAEVLATRGDRLALQRLRLAGSGSSSGPSEVEFLQLVEVDERGDRVAAVAFDPDDLDAAYAELDQRYHAGEAAPYARVAASMGAFHRAFAARDWDALAAQCAPDLVVNDHRLIGWEPLHGPAAYVQALRSLVDLAPDTKLRLDHVTMSERGYLVITVWVGTREGGAFDAPSFMVAELDDLVRIRRFDQYDLERLDEARACFEELRPDPLRIPPNAATRARDRYQEAIEAKDLEAVAELCAPALMYEDRRRFALTSGDRDMFIASSRMTISFEPSLSRSVLATAGDRLALFHLRWKGAPEGVAYEGENLSILEVDAEGRIVAVVDFDPDDRRAASAELHERFARGEEARRIPAAAFELIQALGRRDLAAIRSALSDDFVFDDHRRTGLGRLEGTDAYLAAAAALFEEAPDLLSEVLYYVTLKEHGQLAVVRRSGTLSEGGEFESIFARIVRYAGDRVSGLELFELEDVERARARLAELRPDPLRIPPNAATRVRDRAMQVFAARDWQGLRALTSDSFQYEDRRRHSLLSGGVELWIQSGRLLQQFGAGVQFARELIGTVGDRIALERVVFGGGPKGGEFEVELIMLTEVDADGRLRASIHFDPQDRPAAFAGAFQRFLAGEAAGVPWRAPFLALGTAFGQRDWNAMRKRLSDDVVIRDHRPLGLGVATGDEWIASLRAAADLAPDVSTESFRTLAWSRHGRVVMLRLVGTLRDGGAFENVFIGVQIADGEHMRQYEFFDVADADRALARFEELCTQRS